MCHVTTVRRRVVTKVTKVTKLWLLHLFAVKKYNRYISVAIFFSRLSSVSLLWYILKLLVGIVYQVIYCGILSLNDPHQSK